uniref:Amino acid transporter transmembrane domain-containing protein n=1 Tax=Oryza glumipatula TaxID=40148 RepID=A0A0D9YB17_9ORYZ
MTWIMVADKSPIDKAVLHGKHEQDDLRDDKVVYDVEQKQLLLPTPRLVVHHWRFLWEELPQPQQRDLRWRLSSLCITGASFGSSYLNLSNVISGIEMLFVPYALSQGGWLSLVLFTMVGANCFYTSNLIDRCMRANRCIWSYLDIGHRLRRLWPDGYQPRHVRRALLCRHQLPHSRGRQLDKLLPGTLHGKQLFVLTVAIVILSTTWLKNLAGLGRRGRQVLPHGGKQPLESEQVAHHLPTTLSLYFFVYFIGHGVFPTVYSLMKSKKDFPKVLLISSVLCSLNYAVTTLLRYLIYGEDVQVQVTLNLPSGKLYTRITILTTLITLLEKYGLEIQLIATVIKEKLSLTTAAATDAENNRVLTSTAVVVSTVVLACTVPFFSYLMSFNGSSLNVTIAVLFPCLSYLKIYMP